MSRLLVIEDDEMLRLLTAEILETEGYQVDTAADGATGIAVAQAQRPDLILCDIVMGGLDGYAVLAALRQDPLTATIPVIFLTGVGEPVALRKGMELGADDYLTKPVSSARLVGAVAARLSRSVDLRRESLRRFDALRGDLARALPHEFLTPLTVVMGLSSMLMEEGAVETADVREVARGIYLGAIALQRTIEKFLFYAELEAAEAADAGSAVKPDAIPSVITEAARAEAMRVDRGSDLVVEVETIPIAMPKEHLEALVTQLVENAMKFSKSPSKVSVQCRAGEDASEIVVADLGQGMTPDHLASLMRAPFLRRHQEQPGSGLGLAIVRRLVKLHGGELAFETEPGHGTTARVRLPKAGAGG
jgi:signal transduction histidine kinase